MSETVRLAMCRTAVGARSRCVPLLATMKARMWRFSDGRLLGRPPGEGARYSLTGLVTCSVCRGGFEALVDPGRGAAPAPARDQVPGDQHRVRRRRGQRDPVCRLVGRVVVAREPRGRADRLARDDRTVGELVPADVAPAPGDRPGRARGAHRWQSGRHLRVHYRRHEHSRHGKGSFQDSAEPTGAALEFS